MIRLIAASAMCLGILSGCATTQNIVNKVSSSERSDLRKDLSTVEIRQYFNQVENPTAAEVKVTETGLLDDSLKSIRTIYRFKNVNDDWKLIDTQKAYQCARGKNKGFQSARCP